MTDQQDFEGGVKKSQSPQSITKRQVGSVFLGLFVFRVQQTQGVLVFFATMFFQWNMKKSPYTGDTPRACFLLVKPNIFLDSSVGRAPDC